MDWQQIVALAIVAVAAIWLVRTQILAPRRGGCGGCQGRAPETPDQPRRSQIVQIDLEPGSRPRPK